MDPTAQLAYLRRRLEDLFREVGTLLLAFAPLDAVLWGDRPDRAELVLTFVSIGLALILASVFSELRRLHG
jgi:hypothetical protein